MTFVVGDVVKLKSGGPEMTVDVVNGSDIRCTWFDGLEAKRFVFQARMLEKVEPVVWREPEGRAFM